MEEYEAEELICARKLYVTPAVCYEAFTECCLHVCTM